MLYTGENLFVLASSQLMGTLVVAGSIVALIILVIVFTTMTKPAAGRESSPEPVRAAEEPVSEEDAQESSGEKKRTGTPGFTLPLPSQGAPVPGSNPQPVQAKAPEPAPNRQEAPPADPILPEEQTLDLHKAGYASVTAPQILAPNLPTRGLHRSLLVFRSGARAGESILLDRFPNRQCAIGRSDVSDNQVVVRDDPKVSRVQHAILACDSSGRYTIRDNNSANKVFVNGKCLDSAPAPLNDGDRIRLGLTEFEYVMEPAS